MIDLGNIWVEIPEGRPTIVKTVQGAKEYAASHNVKWFVTYKRQKGYGPRMETAKYYTLTPKGYKPTIGNVPIRD